MNQVHHYFHTLNKLNSLLNFLLSYVFIKNVKNDSRHNNRPIITSVSITLAKVLRGEIDRFGFDKLLNPPAHFKITYYIIQMIRCVIQAMLMWAGTTLKFIRLHLTRWRQRDASLPSHTCSQFVQRQSTINLNTRYKLFGMLKNNIFIGASTSYKKRLTWGKMSAELIVVEC